MASRRTSSPPTLRQEQALDLLRTQLKRGQELLGRYSVTDHDVWENTTREYLAKAFGSGSTNVDHFMEPSYNRLDFADEDWAVASRRAMGKQVARLRGCIDQLEGLGAAGSDQRPGGDRGDWEGLLHDAVRRSALQQYRDGHWRDAVLNALIAVFDLVRSRTGLDMDGDPLVTRAFSADRPLLAVADLSTESGRNDQVGFMILMQGAYRGVRNPKAHSLQHDLTALSAAQYLVFASLLARRVEEARSTE